MIPSAEGGNDHVTIFDIYARTDDSKQVSPQDFWQYLPQWLQIFE